MGNQSLKRIVLSMILACIFCGVYLGQSNPSYDRVAIDSLDADGWNGIVFLPEAFHRKVAFRPSDGSQNRDPLSWSDFA